MMTAEVDEAGFLALIEKIARERAFGCGSYKEKCLRRRIAVRMRARGVHRFADYAALLDRDAVEYERLIDTLTINVTKLFRNWSTFDALARQVVPILWEGAARPIRGWSAGCSSGEEPYSLGILFHQHAAASGEAADASRVQILASDIDRASLDAARRGQYAEAAFADTPSAIRRRYFSVRPPFEVAPEIRPLVTFERRDLIVDPTPSGLHLIACRNVLIYFDRNTQETLFQRFHDALAPGGFLVLGKVETLLGPTRSLFTAVDPRERIFRRR
ncbi:MAG TPA: protein-glutamate O-methyltransferase CheR [Gemmatimonadaceae bacterium]|nr:protein-glutamate O-methyltransferase CheR [Gemmatimonadaceae bacterium]